MLQVCRLAYEIMNSLQPDASAKFTSLDDTFYFHGQVHRLNVALLSHKSEGSEEMDLEVGDEIEEAGNHWDGYSKGKNLRTKKTLLYPTFKVKIIQQKLNSEIRANYQTKKSLPKVVISKL